MPGRLIVVTGTGTGIGKTHVSCAILRCAGRSRKVVGYKPVESGVDGTALTDSERLADAGSFHVKLSPSYQLRAPVSPHLAARMESVSIDVGAIQRAITDIRAQDVDILIELPGGLFTPLTSALRNVDVIGRLDANVVLLLAPDRLGVLHDVGAAMSGQVVVTDVALVSPDVEDASSGTNADELRHLGVAVHGTWPRATEESLAMEPTTTKLVDRWVG